MKFRYSLDYKIAILRNIRWSKLKNDTILRLSLQEKLKHEFETNKIAFENMSVNDKWSYLLKVCTKHATKILGTSNILDNSQMHDFDNVIQILNIRKNKLKRKLKKRNISVTRREKIKLQIDCISKKLKNQRSNEHNEELGNILRILIKTKVAPLSSYADYDSKRDLITLLIVILRELFSTNRLISPKILLIGQMKSLNQVI
eukprot:NODE_131_length_16689_cov_0.437914.p6 type:complete len:202 gc:universal NODE_131_length_16689_cov_0.437914:12166-12771(+)